MERGKKATTSCLGVVGLTVPNSWTASRIPILIQGSPQSHMSAKKQNTGVQRGCISSPTCMYMGQGTRIKSEQEPCSFSTRPAYHF